MILKFIKKLFKRHHAKSDLLNKNKEKNYFLYDGGEVTRSMLEKAIDFLITLEPDPLSPTGAQEYENNIEKYKNEILIINKIIKQYGEQINPKTLENMQDAFYAITNSLKYRQSMIHCSVAYSSLHYGWHGIGPWKC